MIIYNCNQVLIFCRNFILVKQCQPNNGNMLHHCFWHTVWLMTKLFSKNWVIKAYKNQYATLEANRGFSFIFVLFRKWWKLLKYGWFQRNQVFLPQIDISMQLEEGYRVIYSMLWLTTETRSVFCKNYW